MSDFSSRQVGLLALGAVTIGGVAFYVSKLVDRKTSASQDQLQTQLGIRDREIKKLRRQLQELSEDKPSASREPVKSGKKIRLYMDGCFDMVHFGHANALRQAKALGDVLCVGIHTDEEIMRNKGPPVMSYEERLSMLSAIKWVDEIIEDAPYTPHAEWMNRLFTEYEIDYVVHGDDPALNSDGEDAYTIPKRMGKMKIIKRTEGVSTTDIVGRMLLMSRSHHILKDSTSEMAEGRLRTMSEDLGNDGLRKATVSKFLPTTRRILQFSKGISPEPGQRIVYITGAFDLFHVGHTEALGKAREFGDFLLVGIHDDENVNARRGTCLPIMNVHERALSVLSCKYVDEVIIGAPWEITRDLMVTMNIHVVVAGSECESRVLGVDEAEIDARFRVPREMGKFKEFQSSRALSAKEIVDRVMTRRAEFEAKFARKNESEQTYLASKEFVQEQ